MFFLKTNNFFKKKLKKFFLCHKVAFLKKNYDFCASKINFGVFL